MKSYLRRNKQANKMNIGQTYVFYAKSMEH